MNEYQQLINQVQIIQQRFDKLQWWTPEQILADQLRQIDSILQHAIHTIPYYKDRIDSYKLTDAPLTLKEFQKLPILSRSDIQQAGSSLVTNDLPLNHGTMFDVVTSGSTGIPLKVKGTSYTGMQLHAFTLRGHLWHKRDFKGTNVTVKALKNKQPVKHYASWAIGQETGPAIEIDATLSLNSIFDMIIQINPEYLHLHPTTLRSLLKSSIKLSTKPEALREVRTMGEVVDDDLRELCFQEWNIPLTDMYSTEEFNTITHQCPDHLHGHVQADNVLVEILNKNDEPCNVGEVGRVVVTSLTNYATPLIRCDLEDYAELGDLCSCGRGLLVLKKIFGRTRNMVILPDGDQFFPVFTVGSTLADLPIIQHRLAQTSLADIEVRLVVERELTEDEKDQIRDYFSLNFGHPFNFHIVYVDELLRGANGKYEFFISEMEKD